MIASLCLSVIMIWLVSGGNLDAKSHGKKIEDIETKENFIAEVANRIAEKHGEKIAGIEAEENDIAEGANRIAEKHGEKIAGIETAENDLAEVANRIAEEHAKEMRRALDREFRFHVMMQFDLAKTNRAQETALREFLLIERSDEPNAKVSLTTKNMINLSLHHWNLSNIDFTGSNFDASAVENSILLASRFSGIKIASGNFKGCLFSKGLVPTSRGKDACSNFQFVCETWSYSKDCFEKIEGDKLCSGDAYCNWVEDPHGDACPDVPPLTPVK